MTARPLQPAAVGRQTIYPLAGGNHVTIELDREDTGGRLDVIEMFAQPGGGPSREISARPGIAFWTGPVQSPDGNG